MPLIAMSSYVNPDEQRKIAFGYALPTDYPLGLNGMGCSDCGGTCGQKMSGLGCADCGGTCGQMRGLEDWVPTAEEMRTGTSTNPLGQAYFAAQKKKTTPSSGQAQGSSGGFFNQIVDAFGTIMDKVNVAKISRQQSKAAAQSQNPPPMQFEKEEKQDWMMPAIIAGGVIVATVLAVSIGRRR